MPSGHYKRKTRDEYFFSKVVLIPFHSCWEWIGGLGEKGYGIFSIGKGSFIHAHRYSYSIHKNEPKRENVIMHSCDNRSCVNPLHLTEGTQKENINDAQAKGRLPKASKTKKIRLNTKKRNLACLVNMVCANGHDLTKVPWKFQKDKKRGITCTMCVKIYKSKYKQLRKEKLYNEQSKS